MAFDALGKLHVTYDTKQVSERFSKREFVVEIADGKFPQYVLFQLTGDRCAQLDDHRVGDMVRVTFNVRGREWQSPQGETKYFNSLDVWKLEPAETNRRAASTSRGTGEVPFRDDPRPTDLMPAGRDDDLPF
jgi:single-strand DNA-binding protein